MEDCKFLLLGLLLSTLNHLCYGQHGLIHHGGLSREYLLAFNTRAHQDLHFLNSIAFRGERGGVRQRLRRMKCKPPLPSMILVNVRSLKGLKMDELRRNVTETLVSWHSPKPGSTAQCLTRELLHRDLDVLLGLTATRKRPERREVGCLLICK